MHDMLYAYNTGKTIAQCNRRPWDKETMDRRPNSAAHDMAIVMIIGKLARIATGLPHADNYDDIIGYCKIARQHAIRG